MILRIGRNIDQPVASMIAPLTRIKIGKVFKSVPMVGNVKVQEPVLEVKVILMVFVQVIVFALSWVR